VAENAEDRDINKEAGGGSSISELTLELFNGQ
jgi:hypothetical protein